MAWPLPDAPHPPQPTTVPSSKSTGVSHHRPRHWRRSRPSGASSQHCRAGTNTRWFRQPSVRSCAAYQRPRGAAVQWHLRATGHCHRRSTRSRFRRPKCGNEIAIEHRRVGRYARDVAEPRWTYIGFLLQSEPGDNCSVVLERYAEAARVEAPEPGRRYRRDNAESLGNIILTVLVGTPRNDLYVARHCVAVVVCR